MSPVRRIGRGLAVVFVALALGASAGCSVTSETVEAADDPADVTIAGPLPTAPPIDESTSGLSGATRLISEIEAISEQEDLCEVLTGDAFARLTGQDPETAGLVTSPAGVTQLAALIERTFDHLVVIAPADVRADMEVVRGVWLQIVAIGPAPDATQRAEQIATRPEVIAALQQLALWASRNCAIQVSPAD